ncbi:MAG: hypothetical protein AB1758_02775 [Candidatus Eremiobacterota bacterium]
MTVQYHSSLSKLAVLGVVLLLMAGVMAYVGMYFNVRVPVEMREPGLRLLAVYIPFALSVAIVLMLIGLAVSYASLNIEVGSIGVTLNKRGNCTTVGWATMVVHRPANANLFSSALISDGERHIRVQRFFWPEFEAMLDRIERTIKQSRGAKTLKM